MKFFRKIIFTFFSKVTDAFITWRVHKKFYEYLKDSDKEISVFQAKPVIILGMHRSGTTLLVKLMKEAGMHIGFYSGPFTAESILFQSINKAVFKLFHTRWDNAEIVRSLNDHPDKVDAFAYAIAELLSSKVFFSYSGFRHISLQNEKDALCWGWKDPRNTFTLPIWLRLFPNAQILGIRRNGVDVAQSLMKRNENGPFNGGFSLKCMTFEGAFSIWEEYNQECEMIESRGNCLFLEFEQLVKETDKVLYQTLKFIDLSYTFHKGRGVYGSIDPTKSYAFLAKESTLANHECIEQSEQMANLGYTDTLRNESA